jgi:choline dehydrogenase-like flavoprotein
MMRDARLLPSGSTIDADVCIVGAGPAGIVVAGELAGSGAQVVLLDSGGETEARRTRALLGGESVGYPYPRLTVATASGFGGTSGRWGEGQGYWHARPLDRVDFERRPGVPDSGWPFDRDELAPYYARAEGFFGLRPFDLAAGADDVDAATRLPLRPGRFVVRELRHGRVPFARERERLAAADDVQVLLHAHVAEVSPGGDGRVAGVRVVTGSGRAMRVRAGTVVLAGGGIGNARLLLLGNGDHPQGIGNEHDLVGRFFMEHLAVRTGIVVPEDGALLESDLLSVNEADGERFRPVLVPADDVLRSEAIPNTYFHLEARPWAFAAGGVRAAADLARGVRCRPLLPAVPGRVARVAADLRSVARSALASRLGSENEVVVVRVQSEQVPNADSRVTLSRSRNAYGIPRARLDWRVTDADLGAVRRAQELLGEELRAAGAGRLEDLLGDERPPALISGHHHHLGTTRMHDDPAHGVVDRTGRVHGLANLFVTGGSVFPTGGAANPTLTIVALAMRLADHLRQEHAVRAAAA